MPEPIASADLPLLRTHSLAVDGGHVLQVQEFGLADGIPALVLHGGPGSGSSPVLRRGFDGRRYRVICVDQRGAGGSTPRGRIEHNTTADLLADLRLVRAQLGITRWLVNGGSWGASLAIAYAAEEPQAVSALLLRSSFLARREDVQWFFEGAAAVRPQAWQRLRNAIDGPLLESLARMLREGSLDDQRHAASAWWAWETALATGTLEPTQLDGTALARQVDRLRVQAHYLRHDCWLDCPPLLDRCAALPRVPTLLLHARDDFICPAAGAEALQRCLPHARLQWLAEGGHDAAHPLMTATTAAALDHFAATGGFGPAP